MVMAQPSKLPDPVGPRKLEVVFSELASKYLEINPSLQPGGDSQRKNVALTKATLKHYFDLDVNLPLDRLCPPVPVRFEYIRVMQELLDTTSTIFNDKYDPNRKVVGIDIGTGASCIYPLLGCAVRPQWEFKATDIDQENFATSTQNVAQNNLQDRIRVFLNAFDGPLLPLSAMGINNADFVMCNPPFYGSREEKLNSANQKDEQPFLAIDGADVEMVTPGGDFGFAKRILEASCVLKTKIQWYSCMMGKYESAKKLAVELKARGISNWASIPLEPGNRTKRWVIAWSFHDRRPTNSIAGGTYGTADLLPQSTEYRIQGIRGDDEEIGTKLAIALSKLELKFDWREAMNCGWCFAMENVWTRRAKRQIAREGYVPQQSFAPMHAALGVKVSVMNGEGGVVVVRWLKGWDLTLWTSLCAAIKSIVKPSASQRASEDVKMND